MPDNQAQYTDQQLWQSFKSSQNNAYLGILLKRHSLMLLGVCMQYLKNEEEARDAAQQVCLKTLQEAGKYDIPWFKSWLYTVAKNHCLLVLKRRQRTLPEEEADQLGSTMEDVFETKNIQENKEKMLQWVEQGLSQLNDIQKQCVTLFYLEKNSYQQISDRTGHDLLLVKSAIQNGKRNIRIWVEKKIRNAS